MKSGLQAGQAQPPLKGLTLPGMAPGSPGTAGPKQAPFIAYAIDGTENPAPI
jgi:hypothetical protein